jgi:hypothetical protein
MDVTLLFVDGCPNWQVTDARLCEALARTGRDDVRVQHRLISTPEQAEDVDFRGSPSVLVDGRDPFATTGAAVGLSCRIYRTEAGPAGAPTVEQLLDVLR